MHRISHRAVVAAATLAVVVLLSGCLTTGQTSVLDAMNADRGRNNLPDLAIQADAQAKAQAWAEKIAADGRLTHSILSQGIGVRWCRLGENVGYANTVQEVQNAYMGSAGHRGNILNGAWNGVGVGHAIGKVNGRDMVFTVQFFIQTC